MKKTIYFKTEEEKNNYFPNGVPSNVLAIVQSDGDSPAVLYTSSNNSPMKGTMESQGGYITNPADEARITYIESYFATQEYVDDAIANAAVGAEVDLSNYALKSELPSLNGYATESYVSSEIGKISIPSLDGYATQTWVENQDYLTQHQDISEKADKSELASYVSKTELSSCGYLTTHQDLSNYALKSELPIVPSLEGYATESYVISKIEDVVGAAPAALDTLKEIGDSLNNDSDFAGTMTTALASKANASDVYTKSEIDNAGFLTTHQSLADYATKAEISAAGYLTSHQDISGLVSKTELSSLGYITANDIPASGGGSTDEDIIPNTNNTYSLGYGGWRTNPGAPYQDYLYYKSAYTYSLYLSLNSYLNYDNSNSAVNLYDGFGGKYVIKEGNIIYDYGALTLGKVGSTKANFDNSDYINTTENAFRIKVKNNTPSSSSSGRQYYFGQTVFSTNGSINLGSSSNPFAYTYTNNLILNGTDATTLFPSYSYVDNKIGSIETALDSILGNS